MKRWLPLLVCLVLALPAHAKSLYWSSFDGQARLDAKGRMRVVERQTIVFYGDWNGAERWVDLRRGQSLTVHGVSRIVNGVAKPLVNGDLEKVDHYSVVDGAKIRWRSRLPSDPEFSLTEITYVVDYSVGHVLLRDGKNYYLAHNFVMPERQGRIDNFKLHLELDPVWTGSQSPIVVHRDVVSPGKNVTIERLLHYAGAGAADARLLEVRAPRTSRLVERIILALFLLAGGFLIWRFFRGEFAVGRFGALNENVDEAWLREHVLHMLPEVAGAALHGRTGAHEVAATLARMESEGKIATRVEGKVLHIRRLIDEEAMGGYETRLAKKIFRDGPETDTKRMRRLYRKSGLDLAGLIDSGIQGRLRTLREWRDDPNRQNMKPLIRALIAAGVLIVLSSILGDFGAMLFFVFISLFPLVFARASAAHASGVVSAAWIRLAAAFFFAMPIVVMPAVAYLLDVDLHWVSWVTLSWCSLLVLQFILEASKIEQTREKVLLRRRLGLARAWFKRQLRAKEPQLRDEWFPYLIAFGLGSNVHRWFRAHGVAAHAGGGAGATLSTSSSSSSSSSGGGWSFSGGGGAFGGAGATGGWGSAAATMAVGVGTTSSGRSGGGSSSSSSSSSSGGSSGGGGGGGW